MTAPDGAALLWSLTPERAAGSAMARFIDRVGELEGRELADYEQLWEWSTAKPETWTTAGGSS